MKFKVKSTAVLLFCLIVLFCLKSNSIRSQTIDSIAFHLYTDSLKKGVHNYINVDGRLSGGSWLPLTGKELQFTSSAGIFEGNNLILDGDFSGEKVKVTATYLRNLKLTVTTTIYIKILSDNETILDKEDSGQPGTMEKKPRKKKKGNQ